MKRSEMISHLVKYMDQGSGMLISNEEFEDWEETCADDILALLEELGMLPPHEHGEPDAFGHNWESEQ